MLQRAINAIDRIGECLAYAGMLLLSAAITASIVDIACRRTIGFSITGINDIMQLFVMACICLAMPLTFVREGHVGVEFITDRLSPRVLGALECIVGLVMTGFVATLTWFAWQQAMQQIQRGDRSQTLGLPIVLYWTPLLVGMALAALASLALTVRYLVVAAGGSDIVPPRADPLIAQE